MEYINRDGDTIKSFLYKGKIYNQIRDNLTGNYSIPKQKISNNLKKIYGANGDDTNVTVSFLLSFLSVIDSQFTDAIISEFTDIFYSLDSTAILNVEIDYSQSSDNELCLYFNMSYGNETDNITKSKVILNTIKTPSLLSTLFNSVTSPFNNPVLNSAIEPLIVEKNVPGQIISTELNLVHNERIINSTIASDNNGFFYPLSSSSQNTQKDTIANTSANITLSNIHNYDINNSYWIKNPPQPDPNPAVFTMDGGITGNGIYWNLIDNTDGVGFTGNNLDVNTDLKTNGFSFYCKILGIALYNYGTVWHMPAPGESAYTDDGWSSIMTPGDILVWSGMSGQQSSEIQHSFELSTLKGYLYIMEPNGICKLYKEDQNGNGILLGTGTTNQQSKVPTTLGNWYIGNLRYNSTTVNRPFGHSGSSITNIKIWNSVVDWNTAYNYTGITPLPKILEIPNMSYNEFTMETNFSLNNSTDNGDIFGVSLDLGLGSKSTIFIDKGLNPSYNIPVSDYPIFTMNPTNQSIIWGQFWDLTNNTASGDRLSFTENILDKNNIDWSNGFSIYMTINGKPKGGSAVFWNATFFGNTNYYPRLSGWNYLTNFSGELTSGVATFVDYEESSYLWTIDGNGNKKTYKDNILLGETTWSGNLTNTAGDSDFWVIGGGVWVDYNQHFEGSFNNIRVWNKAVDWDTAHYYSTSPSYYLNTIGYSDGDISTKHTQLTIPSTININDDKYHKLTIIKKGSDKVEVVIDNTLVMDAYPFDNSGDKFIKTFMMAGGNLNGSQFWQPAYNATYGGTGSGNGMLTFPEDPFVETQDWTNGFSIYFKMYSNGANSYKRLLSYRLSEGGSTHYQHFMRTGSNISFDSCGNITGLNNNTDYIMLFIFKPDGSQECWKDGVLAGSANLDTGRAAFLTNTKLEFGIGSYQVTHVQDGWNGNITNIRIWNGVVNWDTAHNYDPNIPVLTLTNTSIKYGNYINLQMKDLSILPIYVLPTTNSHITIKTVGLYDHYALKLNDDDDNNYTREYDNSKKKIIYANKSNYLSDNNRLQKITATLFDKNYKQIKNYIKTIDFI